MLLWDNQLFYRKLRYCLQILLALALLYRSLVWSRDFVCHIFRIKSVLEEKTIFWAQHQNPYTLPFGQLNELDGFSDDFLHYGDYYDWFGLCIFPCMRGGIMHRLLLFFQLQLMLFIHFILLLLQDIFVQLVVLLLLLSVFF